MQYASKINDFEDALNSHPNYPSLLAITDSLTFIGIENIAAKVPFQHIEQLPNVFIIELDAENKTLNFLEKLNDGFKILDENEKTRVISFSELENIWTGIVLIIEENEHVEKFKSTNYKVSGFVLIVCCITILVNNWNIQQSVFLLIATIGVLITIEIVKTYFEDNNASESKFCSINKEFSCNSIIKSKEYPFSKYIEFVDLPVIFFTFSFLGLLFSIVSVYSIGIVSLGSLPIIGYSIYLQKSVVKKWCLLCLLISSLLVVYTILFVLYFNQIVFTFNTITNEILLFITIAIIWFYVKKMVLQNNETKHKLNALLRFKRNEDVFYAIAEETNNSEELNLLSKICIGNANAQNTLTLFLSPSCPHCHIAFKDALEIQRKHPNAVKIEVAYNLNNKNTENPYLVIAKVIMQMNNQSVSCLEPLEDWHINKLSLEEWKTKWKHNDEFILENEQLKKQFQWCVANEFNYAPVKLFNGKLLPQVYEIEELLYFFKEEN